MVSREALTMTTAADRGEDLFLFTDLRDELARYLDEEQVSQITEAYLFALNAHAGQVRETGDPYITHPIAVGRILSSMRLDHETVMAALLHDVLEDTSITKTDLAERFGSSVAELVDGVSKLQQIQFESRAERQAENFRKMVLAMVRDIRVILIKLADRLHNMRTLSALDLSRRARVARETLEIHAPIANRLGMNHIKVELEELGFAALYPMRYRVINESVRRSKRSRKEAMGTIQSQLKQVLAKAGILADRVDGREKHVYSIYKKMRNKHLSFHEIMDVYAFRITVEKIDDCYRILGLVHNLYKPVPGRFKDYIAIPKVNGYQSLHTTLFGPQGFPIEIQIRSRRMHRMAEKGIASHWLYKSMKTSASKAQVQAKNWLKGLMDLQNRSGDSLEFIEHVKVDLFPDEVYVFTPKGDIMELPNGATAVDFAYAVHTDIGNSCVAVKMDRRLAPLSTVLSTGQSVEIMTSSGARPNPAWLSFVVTGKAKSHIRHYLKNQKKSESIILGRRLVDAALFSFQLKAEEVPPTVWEQVLLELKQNHLDDLFEAVGLGNRMAAGVAQQVHALIDGTSQDDLLPVDPESAANQSSVAIFGSEGMMVQFARCCWPIPGDHIVGFQTSGQGLMVHTAQCRNVMNLGRQLQNCVHLRWAEHIESEFPVELEMESVNQRGMLAKIAMTIAGLNANIEHIRLQQKDGHFSELSMIVSVKDRDHLARIIRKFRAMKEVTKIGRNKI